MQNSNKITTKKYVGVQISLEQKKIVALRLSRTGFHTHKGSSKTEKEKAGQNNKRVVLQDFRLMIEFPDSSCVNILMRL